MSLTGKSPEDYQIEDFITDESFINYFFHLNAEDSNFWTKWLIAHPENVGLAEMAREMLRNLTLTLPETEFETELSKMQKAIQHESSPAILRKPAMIRFLRGKMARRSLKDNKVKGSIKY